MNDFNGVKIALITDDNKLLVYLRDNTPGLWMAGKWDLPGGGREDQETPIETAIREIYEEFEIRIEETQITYQKTYPSDRFIGEIVKFMVGRLTPDQVKRIVFGSEGQRFKFIDVNEYATLYDAVPSLQVRLNDYLSLHEHQ